jgi:hypothetical protein
VSQAVGLYNSQQVLCSHKPCITTEYNCHMIAHSAWWSLPRNKGRGVHIVVRPQLVVDCRDQTDDIRSFTLRDGEEEASVDGLVCRQYVLSHAAHTPILCVRQRRMLIHLSYKSTTKSIFLGESTRTRT